MKKIIFAALLFALCAPLSAQKSGHEHTTSGVLGMQIRKFERVGDQVAVAVDMNLSGRRIRPTERYEITPVIVAGGQSRSLPSIVVNGNNKRHIARRARVIGHSVQTYGAAGAAMTENVRLMDNRTVQYTATVPYAEWMRGAMLRLDTRLLTCLRAYDLTETIATLHAPAPHPIEPQVTYVAPEKPAVKMREIAATAFIDYEVNRTNIVRSFRNNPTELDKIESTINKVKNNKDMTFKGVMLEGYASPEGGYANNERLAAGRVNALKSYIVSQCGVPASEILVSHVAEDWAGLRAEVAKSSIEAKEEILAIIDGGDAPDAREARLKTVAGGRPWRIILRDMMPPLRRTDYRIDYTVRDYAVQDSRSVLASDPTMLSHYELDALAREHDQNSPEYARIYDLIEAQNPTDELASVNVAAFRISRGDLPAARRALERVDGQSPAYFNNMGVLLLREGEYDEALRSLQRAGNNPEAQHNIREINKYLESVK
jgi:outer membrane protein OmpA-like peptidoglycan-associated protein